MRRARRAARHVAHRRPGHPTSPVGCAPEASTIIWHPRPERPGYELLHAPAPASTLVVPLLCRPPTTPCVGQSRLLSPLTPLPSFEAMLTRPLNLTRAYERQPFSSHARARVHRLPLPPSRARPCARSRHRPSRPTPPLGPSKALTVACLPAFAYARRISSRGGSAAAATRRNHLRSCHHHQSSHGKLNRTPR